MVAVTVGLNGKTIRIRSYVDGPVEQKDIERIQFVSTEVIADFVNDGFTIAEECLPVGVEKPQMLDFWAFYRAKDDDSVMPDA
jgi:hypothetical protein